MMTTTWGSLPPDEAGGTAAPAAAEETASLMEEFWALSRGQQAWTLGYLSGSDKVLADVLATAREEIPRA